MRWLAESTVIMNGINVSAVAADWLALTAEVERLRGVGLELLRSVSCETLSHHGKNDQHGFSDECPVLERLRAALSLPTNAPEAKE